MGKKANITHENRAKACAYKEIGWSNRKIAAKLNISECSVRRAVKRREETGSHVDRQRSGRPRKTSKIEDDRIVILSKRDRRCSAVNICSEINKTREQPVSVTTVKNRLLDVGLFGRVAIRKPLLKTVHKQKRLQWAKIHSNWTMEQWKKVLWTDESKFEKFGSNRRQYVRRRAGERVMESCIIPSVKHGGGNVMVWGCFGNNQVGDLVRVEGILEKKQYHRILGRNAVPSGMHVIGEGFVLQQDNDPKHTSHLCKQYLERKQAAGKLELMVWPPQSPDLSPIELLWEELDRKVKENMPNSVDGLWQCLLEAWGRITTETLDKLTTRMPRICKAVIKAKGGHIDERAV